MSSSYKYIQALSIDVTLGGIIGALFIADFLGVDLELFVLLELSLTIWLIYTFDHLVDAGSGFYTPVTFRHKLHSRYSTGIWGIWSFLLVAACSLLYKVPTVTLIAGGILALVVIIYFISLKLLEGEPLYHKEITGALIYSTGVFIGPVSIYQGPLSFDLWALYVEFIILAFTNLLIFAMFEKVVDEKSGFQSLARSLGYKQTRTIALASIGTVIILSVITMVIYSGTTSIFSAQLVILFMAIIFTVIVTNKNTLIIHERFRIIGDAVFLIPVFYLII